MQHLSRIPDQALLEITRKLAGAERACIADVIEALVEIEARGLHLEEACSSICGYCIERLGYSEDEASKRARVTRLARAFPRVLDVLRAGTIHLSGLCVLAPVMTQHNWADLLAAASGKSKRGIEELVAARFPKPDVPDRLCPVPEQRVLGAANESGAPVLSARRPGAETVSGDCARGEPPLRSQGPLDSGWLKPLSSSKWVVQFTATRVLKDKIEHAHELSSHALRGGTLADLVERAFDVLIEHETKRLKGSSSSRRRRSSRQAVAGPQPPPNRSRHAEQAPVNGSRRVPLDVARIVWERDAHQCAFHDTQGRRCSARHFITIEHRHPYSKGGPPTAENLCLLCSAHNADAARKVFGAANVRARIAARKGASRSQAIPRRDDVVTRERSKMERLTRFVADEGPVGSEGPARFVEPIAKNGEPRAESTDTHQPHRDPLTQVAGALRTLGFRQSDVLRALNILGHSNAPREPTSLLRKAIELLLSP